MATSERLQLVPPAHVLEFGSLVRKAVTRRELALECANAIVQDAIDLLEPSVWFPETFFRAYELASRLNQSDIFDAAGYATAETLDAEFWTSDRRFANAAAHAGLQHVRFID